MGKFHIGQRIKLRDLSLKEFNDLGIPHKISFGGSMMSMKNKNVTVKDSFANAYGKNRLILSENTYWSWIEEWFEPCEKVTYEELMRG